MFRMKSIIAHQKIVGEEKQDVLYSVKNAMELAQWQKYVKGKKVFLKVNLLSDQLVPGQCTSPWILEGVIKVLLDADKEIVIGDTDVATSRQLEKSAKIWGVIDLCEKYKIPFVNLSKTKTINVKVNGEVFDSIDVPAIIKECDSRITLPVMKTHNVTIMTCALKNQWGCIPRFRHQFHDVTNYAIPEINKAVGMNFALVDATICMEDSGPRTGIPKIVNSIFATHDLVAMDALAAKIMNLDVEKVEYIKQAERIGLGAMDYACIGDKIEITPFKPAIRQKHPIVYTEMILRKIPFVSYLIFKTPFFHIPAFFASRYNSFWWYNLHGKKYAREIVDKNPLYRKEFLPLLQRIGVY